MEDIILAAVNAITAALYLPMVRFFIVGGVVYAFGMALLALLVEKFRVSKAWASFVMLVVTLQLSFILNHFWSFASTPADSFSELLARWAMYNGARTVPVVMEWLGFVILVNKLKIPYIIASLIVVALGFVFVYALSAALIFVDR